MSKEDFFSKLNIKDYNNQLENILEVKFFSEGSKNILLNILYKMETAYDDYKKVKVQVGLKKELLEEIINIINYNCDEIEIVKPKLNEKTKLEDKKYIVEKDKRRIISYPNEKTVFFALNRLKNKEFVLDSKYSIIKKPMEELLNQGYIMDIDEIIRDFDGWTWNTIVDEIENITYNLIYQNIKILLGYDFLKNSMENNKTIDFVAEFENKLNEIYNEKKYNISKLIYQIAILVNIKNNNNKEDILKTKEELSEELKQIENKKEYLQKIANLKKTIGKNIKEIDEKINNNKLLREGFIEENKLLEENKRIFSLSEYSEILQEKRESMLKQLDEYSEIMKPMNFVRKKTELSKKYELLNEINFDAPLDEEIYKLLIDLQIKFLKLFNEKIKNIQSRKEIIEYIYLFRYYKLIYLNYEKQIKDVEELQTEIRKTEKHLITKACKLKAMNILCQDIEKNYELVSKILSYNIIELEDVNLEFKKHEKNIVVTIYDDDTIEDSIIYDGNEELNVKFNKKMKLFN